MIPLSNRSTKAGAIHHPGTPAQHRYQAQRCYTKERDITLEGGQTLHDAIVHALEKHGITAAYLTINDAAMESLHFVMPGNDPSGAHAAWYSDTYRLSSPARILTAGAHVGLRDGEPFLHCHGTWQHGREPIMAGHLLAPDSLLATDVTASCISIEGAHLVVTPDEETRFSLFAPYANTSDSTSSEANAILLTLRPNQDIHEAITSIAERHEIPSAQILGIGSLINTCFTDGIQLESHANEILILDGRLESGQLSLQALSVGIGGEQHQGELASGCNTICVTCELLLRFP